MSYKRLLVLAVGVLALLGSASTASGSGKPSRELLGNQPFSLPAGVGCAFPTYYQPLVDREILTTFPAEANGDVRALITGTLTARLTNLADPRKSITVNISGPGFVIFHPDGSVDLLGGGISAWPFGPTDTPAGPNWWLFRGRLNMTITSNGQLVLNSISGRKQDLCLQLS
jgi:hypothetical protein